MENLPIEMMLSVLEFLELKDIVRFGETCHVWHFFVRENAKRLTRKVSRKLSVFPSFLGEIFGIGDRRSFGFFHIDPLGRLQGVAKISAKTFSFRDGELHGKCKKTSFFGQNDWVKETSHYKDGKLHGLVVKERNDVCETPELVRQTEIWKEGHLISQDIFFQEKQGVDTIFSLCGELECQGQKWDCYKKTTKGEKTVTTIEYVNGKRFVTVDGNLLEGPREKGNPWSHCCEEHQREMPDLVC
ncbi:F-box containing protein [Marseillevirus marseillevirus]|uniref:F-box containing protein n=1 Tax=Marseillevirus marseillevirus TaxID=694581 RepID=D2XA35_GBMV|nr:F-box containing protein [Marseillevirus marseillevirus]ADB03812.1 F-box containing protein [Marseillevirus marseillevirus]AVR52724.1 putative F-box containing protein [Marseillevirus Shanghai 1]